MLFFNVLESKFSRKSIIIDLRIEADVPLYHDVGSLWKLFGRVFGYIH